MSHRTVLVSAGFDGFGAREARLLEEAASLGKVHVCLWSDAVVQRITGKPPAFPIAERQYFVQAVRYVDGLTVSDDRSNPDALPTLPGVRPDAWVTDEAGNSAARRSFCSARRMEYHVVEEARLSVFPDCPPAVARPTSRKKVIVTGCYDWFHSGHLRFFEEVSELGDLYVVLGSDRNVELLKGPGHPLFKEQQRRYIVGAIRHVTLALVSSGSGWLDAEPAIELLRTDMYAVNEEGDKPEKRAYCEKHGIQYVVLKRTPKEGLTRRTSTDLRGF